MSQPKQRTVIISLLGILILVIVLFAYATVKSLKEITSFDGEHGEYFEGSGNIAVMRIEGVIMSADEPLAKLRELEESKNIKAVVLRIDSPGGAVGPSQEIYDAVLRLRRTKKPVVCSLGDMAASGGYYIASACEKIYANPGTLTGSIGVIMHFMNLKNLYSWVRVQPNIIKAGKFKDIGNEARDMTDDERKLLQDMMNEIHRQFKDAVLIGRNGDAQTKRMNPATLEELADGRVFSGRYAKEKGFVDELGGEFEAIKEAKSLAKITDEKVIREEKGRKGLRGLFDSESSLDQAIHKVMAQVNPATQYDLKAGVPYLLPAYFFEQWGASRSSSNAR